MISVIVPVYKVEKYLRHCVDSILAQTYPDFELLLIDDGSPDGCPQICDEYAGCDPRVKVIHKPNGGLISARNEGIRAARGDYVCILDGDDWALENMLQFIHDTVSKSPEPLDMVLFAAHNVFGNGWKKKYSRFYLRIRGTDFRWVLFRRTPGIRHLRGNYWLNIIRVMRESAFLLMYP